jgi:hypothetical protein
MGPGSPRGGWRRPVRPRQIRMPGRLGESAAGPHPCRQRSRTACGPRRRLMGISRQTAHRWWTRSRQLGEPALPTAPRSRIAHRTAPTRAWNAAWCRRRCGRPRILRPAGVRRAQGCWATRASFLLEDGVAAMIHALGAGNANRTGVSYPGGSELERVAGGSRVCTPGCAGDGPFGSSGQTGSGCMASAGRAVTR